MQPGGALANTSMPAPISAMIEAAVTQVHAGDLHQQPVLRSIGFTLHSDAKNKTRAVPEHPSPDRRRVTVFDVNGTSLDIEALALLFGRLSGSTQARRRKRLLVA